MVGTLPGLPEIWIQQCSVWEMIYFTHSANIGHCIDHGIHSQNLWNQSFWEVLWSLWDVHSMLGILSGLPEIWIQLYSLWEMINFTPSTNMGHCIEQGIYSQNLWIQIIWEVIWGSYDVLSMLGFPPGLPEIWTQLYSVWEVINFTPTANIGHVLNKAFTVRKYEAKVSQKCYEAWRMYIAW